MTEIPVALIAFLALGTAVAVVCSVLLARERRRERALRARVASLEEEVRASARHGEKLAGRLKSAEAEVEHLAAARIPDTAAALVHHEVSVRGVLRKETAGTDLDAALTAVLDQVKEAVGRERTRVDAGAQAALRGAATTVQALLYQMQTLLQRMQEKYDDPLVAEDLLAADFLNEQALRRVQSTAVVCGAWPGLTRQNSHLADIVVGATSRLNGYERIQITNKLRDPVGVVARAVEPVAIALTELMANSLHYSHPDLPVAVTVQQGNRGASVIIDDAGVGMHDDELRRAMRLMAGDEPVLITELGDPPRGGFAAVGQLVRQYGFSTHVETSPYGGVRAIVHIPSEPLLTLLDEEEHPLSAMAPLPPGTVSALGAGAGDGGSDSDSLDSPDTTRLRPSPAPAYTSRRATGTADTPAGRDTAAGTEAGTTAGAPGKAEETAGAGARPGAGAPVERTRGTAELPRRRRRRPASEQQSPAEPVPSTEPTPQQSADRWAAFQQGTVSGRAAVSAAEGPETDPGTGTPGAGEDAVAGTGTGPATDTGGTRADDADGVGDADGISGGAEAGPETAPGTEAQH